MAYLSFAESLTIVFYSLTISIYTQASSENTTLAVIKHIKWSGHLI